MTGCPGENDEYDENEDVRATFSGSPSLRRFGGRMTTPLAFADEQVVIPIVIDDPPAGYDPYWEFWYITPDGERRLYADPPAVADHVGQFHAMDRAVGAAVEWTRTDRGFAVDLSGEDGVDVRLELELGTTPAVRLCNALVALLPTGVFHRAFFPRLAALGARALLGVDDFAVAGETETGAPFRTDAQRIARVTDARLLIDGVSAGEWCRSTGLPDFGDIAAPERPLFVRGGMYLSVEEG